MKFILTLLLSTALHAQTTSAVILQIEVENLVQYLEDTADTTKFATSPTIAPPSSPRNFAAFTAIGDITSVNGIPAKGTMTRSIRQVNMSRTAAAGQGIADITRGAMTWDMFEILDSAGKSIGTIVAAGAGPGAPAPGAPSAVTQGNFVITGGTGAFLGVRGQYGQAVTPQTVGVRIASLTEDPSNRRQNGGGKFRWILHLIPMEQPRITNSAGGPAILHDSDSTRVTASRPAAPGETLALAMEGLGPTVPSVDPGLPFPTSPLAIVNSPIEIDIDGKPAEVLSAIGYPGATGVYLVTFRVPAGISSGTSKLRVTAAWVSARPVSISIQ